MQVGSTALFSAVKQGHSEVVELLLRAGAMDIADKVDCNVEFITMVMNKDSKDKPHYLLSIL